MRSLRVASLTDSNETTSRSLLTDRQLQGPSWAAVVQVHVPGRGLVGDSGKEILSSHRRGQTPQINRDRFVTAMCERAEQIIEFKHVQISWLRIP